MMHAIPSSQEQQMRPILINHVPHYYRIKYTPQRRLPPWTSPRRFSLQTSKILNEQGLFLVVVRIEIV